MNKKGFTLVELLAVIVILAVIAGIAVISYNGITNETKKKVFTNYEASMVNTSKIYYIDHPGDMLRVPIGSSCTTSNPVNKKILLKDLVDGNYLDPFDNPDANDNCMEDSYVLVSGICNEATGRYESLNYKYKACLICKNNVYKSDGC